MSSAQGGAHGRDDADGLSGADLAVLQDLGQGAPVTAFHDQVGAPVGKHSGVDQRDRVRVPTDPAGGRHLPHETSAVALVVQRSGVDLDSHRAPQRDLLPGVDGGESSLPQRLSQTDTGHRRRHVPRSTGNREGTAHGHMIVAGEHLRKPADARSSTFRSASTAVCAASGRPRRCRTHEGLLPTYVIRQEALMEAHPMDAVRSGVTD